MSNSADYPVNKAVAYSLAPWDHVLAYLRFVAPWERAGIQPIRGNLDGQIYPDKVSEADVVLLQRDFPAHIVAYEKITALARAQAKPVVLDLDDLLLDLPQDHPDRLNHHYAGKLFPILRALLEADLVSVSTTQLADVLRPMNPNILVLPNCIDERVWRLTPRRESSRDKTPITIAFMGGDSHLPDFEPLLSVLTEILTTYQGQVIIKSVGMQLPPALQGLKNAEAVSFLFNYPGYVNFVQQQDFDLAIAPLEDNLFNRCKSPIKYLEYSALGIPGVYSNLPPYSSLIKHGENGLLASNPEEWRQAILCLIEDPQLRWKMGQAAQETVRRDWLLGDHAQDWLDAYRFAASRVGQQRQQATLPLRLFADLTHQNRLWEEELETRLQEKENETRQLAQKLIEKEQYIAALSEQINLLRRGFLAKINLGVRRLSARFASKSSDRTAQKS